MAGSAGRYRSRFGKRIRDKISKSEEDSKRRHVCPNCKSKSLKRKSTGIWFCSKCKKKFAGGAWKPKTGASKVVKKALKRIR